MGQTQPAVLFVCSRNGGRSQRAAGLMRDLAGNNVTVSAAGTKPGTGPTTEAVDPATGLGIDITGEHSDPVGLRRR